MRTVVAVLRGGSNFEYDHSLKSGAEVLAALNSEKYEPRDVFISRKGEWHLHGVPVAPERALFGADVVFNALHGHFGEDGQAQALLKQLGVPYTGSDALASAVAIDKQRTREMAGDLGFRVAHGRVVEEAANIETLARELFRSMPQPSFIKPLYGGSGIGSLVAQDFSELQRSLEHAFAHANRVLVEEYIPGRAVSVGVIDHFRNEPTYALLPVPSDFGDAQKNQLTTAAKQMHQALGLRHYSSSDFVVGKRGIYFLESDSLPTLHRESALRRGLDAVGAKLSDFIEHVLQLARLPAQAGK